MPRSSPAGVPRGRSDRVISTTASVTDPSRCMRFLRSSDSRSSRGESGAAMVEMAFVFSLLVMLLVGVVTSAIALGQMNTVENAAREASRYAATYPAPEPPATWQDWLATVRDVARAAAQGNLDASVAGQYICVAHINSGLKLEDSNGTSTVSSGTCYDDGLSDTRVQVVARRDGEISAAFFSIDITLDAPATARYEREE